MAVTPKSSEKVLFALNHTLLQHELRENEMHSSYTTEDLIRHYNCGDLNSDVFGQDTAPVPNITNDSLSDEDATLARNIDLYFRQELIYNRNKRMGSRVVQLMRQQPDQSLFFAFGAGHFLGNNTILDFIQEHGFEVEHMSVNDKIPKSKFVKISSFSEKEKPHDTLPSPTESKSWKDHEHRFRINRPSSSISQKTESILGRILENSTPSPTTAYKPRRFNDLWVRMDTYGKKLIHIGDSSAKNNQLHQQIVEAQFQKSQRKEQMVSGSSRILIVQPLLTMVIILVIVHYKNAFQITSKTDCLTGIT